MLPTLPAALDEAALQKLTAGLSPQQLVWLSGYLYGQATSAGGGVATAPAAVARSAETVAFTGPFNATGQPAVSLPLHWTDDGLPVGVMLAARPAEEELLLAVSAQVEAAAPWVHRRPPGW